jgi:hypothetical protein
LTDALAEARGKAKRLPGDQTGARGKRLSK